MARIALITSEMAGRVQICCELGRRLKAAGHEVVIGSPAPIGEHVIGAGLSYLNIEAPPPPDSGSPRAQGLIGRIGALLSRIKTISTISDRRAFRAALLGVDEFGAAMRSAPPDLAIIDLELGGHHLVATSLGIRTAGWTSMLSVWKRPGLPPLGSDIVPGSRPRGGRLGLEWAWLVFRARRWISDQRLRITRIGEDRISVLRHIARQNGVSFAEIADRWQWLVPFVPHTPAVVFNALELDFPHEPLPSVHYVGPMLQTRPEEIDPMVQELLSSKAAGTIEALVYASFGAWDKGDDTAFLHRIIDMARTRPTWTIVVGLGGRRDPADFGAVPANVRLLAWAPQQAILEHADCAIHHAGISSVNECIRAGVPMVVYPFDFLDQPGNAARVEYHGLGVRGDRDSDAPSDIGGRIDHVLGGGFAENLARLGGVLLELDEGEAAVSAITDLLERDHQSPSVS